MLELLHAAATPGPPHDSGIRRGPVFMPFHYGYWDNNTRPRAANELTFPEWDPVSKQPH